MARFLLDAIDVLVVEEVGKDISGAGMDSNVIGRPSSGLPGFGYCPIRRIVALGISEVSHGGARLPLVANSDLDAIKIALFCGFGVKPEKAKLVQITNTLMMSDMLLSEAYLPLIREDNRFEILSEPAPMQFGVDGRPARLRIAL